MIFFSKALNYGQDRTSPAEVADNRYDTTSSARQIVCHIDTDADGSGTAQTFTHLFIKYVGQPQDLIIAGISATFSPLDTVVDVYGNSLPKDTDGFYNDLIPLADFGEQRVQTVTINFQADVVVAEVMVLNAVLDFTGSEWNALTNYNDIQEIPLGQNKPNATGRQRYVPPLNNERDKWQVPADILFTRQHEQMFDRFTAFRKQHRDGFVFAPDPTFFPHIIAPANFATPNQISYQGRWKRSGRRVRFTVREQ